MNTPIFNPLWFYLISISGQVSAAAGIIGSIMGGGFIIGAILFILLSDDITFDYGKEVAEQMKAKWKKAIKTAFIFSIIGLGITILVPSKEVCYQMIIASYITPDNLQKVQGSTTNLIDYIVDKAAEFNNLVEDNENDSNNDREGN